jgi:hypothetical protein
MRSYKILFLKEIMFDGRPRRPPGDA